MTEPWRVSECSCCVRCIGQSGENARLVARQAPLGPFSGGLLDVLQVRAVTEEIPKSRNAQGGGLHAAALRGQQANVV